MDERHGRQPQVQVELDVDTLAEDDKPPCVILTTDSMYEQAVDETRDDDTDEVSKCTARYMAIRLSSQTHDAEMGTL